MDIVIQPTIILLILSLITEKIANFIKLQKESWANIKDTKPKEKVREKQIQTITLIVGVIVALTAKANLFLLFNKDFNLFWTDIQKGETILSDIIGSIISGLFLSLGSKFFHDLLDMLLQVKNLKRKLNDRADWEFNNLESVDDYLKEDEFNLIENALMPFKEKFMKIENVVSVISVFENDNPILKIYVNDKFDNDNLIPKKVYYLGLKNTPKEAIINIIKEFEPITHGIISPKDKISNLSNPTSFGSLGGRVYDATTNEEYFVSCYHVVKTENQDWNDKKPTENKNIIDRTIDDSNCGLIIMTIRDNEVDVALMKPINDFKINPSIKEIGTPHFSRSVTYSDKKNSLKVIMNGTVSGLRKGVVVDYKNKVRIKYEDDSKNTFENLITIQALSDSTFSNPGDSGSFVLDENNYLIGIIVGGYQNISYVIPIETIFRKTNTKLLKD